MAKKRESPEDSTGNVPLWFLTYTDVITLLMTFFILLLTFATDEPEKLQRMQIALFGGTGATGIAGDPQGPLDKDALVMRMRPSSGRVTTRGSEMPPMETETTLESLATGLAGLEEEKWNSTDSYVVETQLSLLVTDNVQVTAYGQQSLKMLAHQLQKDPFWVVFVVNHENDIRKAVALSQYLIDHFKILPGKVGVSAQSIRRNNGQLRIRIFRESMK